MEQVEAIEAVGLEHPASVGDPGREQCASPIRKRRTRIQRVDVDSRTGSGLSVHVEGANDEPVRGLPASSATSRWPYIGEALGRGALRYQLWKATLHKGSYSVSEDVRIVHADPICMSLPGARCHRSEERRGSGALVPAGSRPIDLAGFAHAELDGQKNTLSLRLPIPLGVLLYTETIVTDEPKGTHDHEPPRGPVRRELDFRALRDIAPFTVLEKLFAAG